MAETTKRKYRKRKPREVIIKGKTRTSQAIIDVASMAFKELRKMQG